MRCSSRMRPSSQDELNQPVVVPLLERRLRPAEPIFRRGAARRSASIPNVDVQRAAPELSDLLDDGLHLLVLVPRFKLGAQPDVGDAADLAAQAVACDPRVQRTAQSDVRSSLQMALDAVHKLRSIVVVELAKLRLQRRSARRPECAVQRSAASVRCVVRPGQLLPFATDGFAATRSEELASLRARSG